MASTKLGTLIKRVSHTQDNHSVMESDSKSDQEWLPTELSSGTNTLVETNTDLESETTCQEKESNGSFSTRELELSELLTEEDSLLLTKRDTDIELVLLLPSDHGLVRSTRELPSTEELEETLETMVESA